MLLSLAFSPPPSHAHHFRRHHQHRLLPHHRHLPPPPPAIPPDQLLPYLQELSTTPAQQPSPPEQQQLLALIIPPLQIAIASVGAYFAAIWPHRPRGWTRTDLIQVRSSPVQGRGLFALQDIPKGTVLGAYPGRPRTPQEMTAKCQHAPLARYYCFRNKNGRFLDPTDWSGYPSPSPSPSTLPWLFPVDVSLAFVNEPPKGSAVGVAVSVEDDGGDEEGLLFVASDDIRQDQEIFVDYGLEYDRSGYGRTDGGTEGGDG